MKKLSVFAFCCIAMIFMFGVASAQAAETSQFNNDVKPYFESVKENGFLASADSPVIAEIDGWKVTQEDLTNRIQEYKEFGKEVDASKIMDVLFEEAVLYAQAEDLSVLPTDAEIEKYMLETFNDKETALLFKEHGAFTDSLKYYAFKYLTFNNVYQYYLNEGRELGLVTPSWTYDEVTLRKYSYGNGDDYYLEKRIAYKKDVNWTTSLEFQPAEDELVQVFQVNKGKAADNEVLCLDAANTVDVMNVLASFSPSLSANGSGRYTGLALDWGYVSLPYNVSYAAEAYIERTEKCLGRQDLLITSSNVGNLNLELRSRVSGAPTNHSKLYKSNGSLISSFWGFNYNIFGSYIYNYLVWGKGAYGGTMGATSNSYYVKATGGLYVEDCTPYSGGTITIQTNSY